MDNVALQGEGVGGCVPTPPKFQMIIHFGFL